MRLITNTPEHERAYVHRENLHSAVLQTSEYLSVYGMVYSEVNVKFTLYSFSEPKQSVHRRVVSASYPFRVIVVHWASWLAKLDDFCSITSPTLAPLFILDKR